MNAKYNIFKQWLAQAINPTLVYSNKARSLYLLILIPACASALLGFQLLTEKIKSDTFTVDTVFIPILAFIIGIAIALLCAAVLFLCSRIFKDTTSFGSCVYFACMSFLGCALYELLGAIISFSVIYNTSDSFGITGIAWLLLPFVNISREFFNNKTIPSVITATLTSFIPVLIWSALISFARGV